MPALSELVADLTAEHDSLDSAVSGLQAGSWATPTPAAGWDIRDSISHLTYFDESATLALTDPERFGAHRSELLAAVASGATPDVDMGRSADGPADVLCRWRASRAALLGAVSSPPFAADRPRVPWYGPAMSPSSFVTARLMETWAHGQDVRDALHLEPVVSPRLRHVLHLGVAARAYAFSVHGVTDPGGAVSVEALAPDGDTWRWGEQGSAERITGTALDLALVFTQRRHPNRTGVRAHGAVACQWLAIAQAFAGPATTTDPGR